MEIKFRAPTKFDIYNRGVIWKNADSDAHYLQAGDNKNMNWIRISDLLERHYSGSFSDITYSESLLSMVNPPK